MHPPTSPAKNHRTLFNGQLPALVALLALTATAQARVASETIYFLQPDGRSYLVERALRTPASSHRFYVDKQIDRDDLRHVEPKDFDWDDSSNADLNILNFAGGGFTLIFPGRFDDARLTRGRDGEFVYKSWDGQKNAQGRFGMWYSPDDFDDFTYTWIVPDNIELLSYAANRRGDWVRRGSAISFYASDANNLTFEIRYRVNPPANAADCARAPEPSTPAAPASAAACPEPARKTTTLPTAVATPVQGSRDNDADGVPDAADLCPGSAPGARVDRAGCSLDTDKDGVPDGIDRCLATPEGETVDSSGCTTAQPR